jgi:hypothetical protein
VKNSKWLRIAGVGLISVLILGACGSDEVPTEEYVADLCSSMVDWQGQAQELSTGLQEEVQANPEMDAEERKDRISTYLEDLKAETESFISNVEDAGTPEVEGGEEVADDLLSGFRDLVGVIEDAQAEVEDLPTDDDEAFQSETDQIGNDLQAGFEEIGNGFESMGGTPIDEAITEEESCSEIQTAP